MMKGHMEQGKPVPCGIENFQELRRRGFYYVDKTSLLTEMLRNPWKVTLFTRPRRFGKTLMLGLLNIGRGWDVQSNVESGLGYTDLLIRDDDTNTAIVIELKYAGDKNLEAAAGLALSQIREKEYDRVPREQGYSLIWHCGIGCHLKRCHVRMERADIL